MTPFQQALVPECFVQLLTSEPNKNVEPETLSIEKGIMSLNVLRGVLKKKGHTLYYLILLNL